MFRSWNRALFMLWVRSEVLIFADEVDDNGNLEHARQISIHWMKLWVDHMFRIYYKSLNSTKTISSYCWETEYVWFREFMLHNNLFCVFRQRWSELLGGYATYLK